jgi:RNA polymerase sigma-70 factor, ECF subfamily
MRADNPDSPLLFAVAGEASASKTSALEGEVVRLFDLLRERLLRYILNFGLPVQDGEEIVQEVFLALFQHLQRGQAHEYRSHEQPLTERPRENLRGWVFRVAHNLALKRRNAIRPGQPFSARAGAENHSPEDYPAVDPAPNPEELMARSQRQQRLSAVLQALPEQDRRCLALRAEGLRYREIAEILNMSLGSVSASLARSLARFARAER